MVPTDVWRPIVFTARGHFGDGTVAQQFAATVAFEFEFEFFEFEFFEFEFEFEFFEFEFFEFKFFEFEFKFPFVPHGRETARRQRDR